MKTVMDEAEREILTLCLVTLEVFGNNPIVQAMYERHGFEEHGRLPASYMAANTWISC